MENPGTGSMGHIDQPGVSELDAFDSFDAVCVSGVGGKLVLCC